jgi:signal transduction histidine kinase
MAADAVSSPAPFAKAAARGWPYSVRQAGVRAWGMGWALGMTAFAGLLLTALGQVAARILLSLAIMAAPAILGGVWRASVAGRALVPVWALVSVIAAALTGGIGGPLAVWCLMPAIAAIALGEDWRRGAAFSLGAAALLALASVLGWTAVTPDPATAAWMSFIAVIAVLLAFAGAWRLAEAHTAQAGGADEEAHELLERLAAAEAGRRQAEIAKGKAEADADARARFLANMSHELRTPLNAIMGFSDVMRMQMFGDLSAKYAEYAGLIHESGGHLMDLINDILDISKLEAHRYELAREVFDVREAVNAALRLMRLQADDAGVRLRAVLPGEPLMVDADLRAVKQIVLNLLSNAVKFTPRDGTVIITAAGVSASASLEIVVADTGMGIAEADIERIGQPYQQAGGAADRARGTGLGLSLVDAFAKLHGGVMTLESRLGHGTAVTVRMPVLVAENGQDTALT